jgi:hypothetical protein
VRIITDRYHKAPEDYSWVIGLWVQCIRCESVLEIESLSDVSPSTVFTGQLVFQCPFCGDCGESENPFKRGGGFIYPKHDKP